MKTIKEVLENQEAVRKELKRLLMNGKSEDALRMISELGYQIRTENQAPLDNKPEFDNEAHELALFLQSVLEDVERKSDLSDIDAARVINAAKKAVREITQDVLKTADIRKSLSEYDVEIYKKKLEEGIKEAEQELAKTQAEYEKLSEIRKEIFEDPSIKYDDSIPVEERYRRIRDHLAEAVKKYSAFIPFASLVGVDFSKMDPSTEEGRRKIENAFKPFERLFTDIDRRRANAQNNIDVFTEELDALEKEAEVLAKDTSDRDAYKEGMDDDTKSLVDAKKAAAHQDNEDKFYGNDEKARKYKEKFIKFKKHIVDAELTYRDKDGVLRTVKGKTVEDYPGMQEDLEFMQLESYRDRLERVTMFRATKDLYAYSPELAKKLERATTDEERSAIKKEISEQFALDSDYIRTFHGAQNRTRMQYEAYRTAGSALKSMVPLKNADTIGGKIAIAAQNVLRYTGLKIPRFSRIDENGKRVSDVKSGLVTVAGDAVIIGACAIHPLAIPVIYGAKTIGVLALKGYGAIYKHRHKDDMDIPTPYVQKAGARRAARERKYREEGSTVIGAWAKAVIDNIRPKHRKEIEAQIIAERNEEIDKSIEDQYIRGAMMSDEKQRRIAIENDAMRRQAHEIVRRSGEVYNDIYREPEMADGGQKRVVDRRIAEATALGMAGEDVSDPSRISFTDSRDPRSTNFAKAKLSIAAKVRLAIESDTKYGERIGETVWTSSIENADVSKSITRTTDVKRRIITFLAGLGLKQLGKFINDQKTVETETTEEVGTGEFERVQVGTHKGGHKIIGYNKKQVTRPATPEDIKVGDLRRTEDASFASFNDGPYYPSGYHPDAKFLPTDDTVQGLSYRFADPSTGRTITYSISGNDIEHIVRTNPNLHEFTEVYSNGHLGITDDTSLADFADFITDPAKKAAYERYLAQFPATEQPYRILDVVELAWGPSETVIGRGWTPHEIIEAARNVVEEVVDTNDPIFSDWIDIPDYELVEIVKTVVTTTKETITDPTLHALKDALEKAGIATALQQLGEATAEVAQPVEEKQASGKPYVGLDSAEDIKKVRGNGGAVSRKIKGSEEER